MTAALSSWWNLIFIIPFALGALLVFVSVLSLLGGHGTHGSHAQAHGGHLHSHGAHGHTHGHVAHNHGGASHATHHAPHHSQHDHSQQQHDGGQKASLPPLLWLQNLLLCWGAIGYGSNLALGLERFHAQSLWIGGLGGVIIAAALGNVLVRLAPTEGSAAVWRGSLEGRLGESVTPIDERGEALVRDGNGTLHHLAVWSEEPIARGVQVLVVAWDEQNQRYRVREWKENLS